jgi:hypothetical protein
MKCCESPRIGAVPDPPARPEATVRELAARFEALLLQSAFAPLAKAIGFYGDTVVGVAAQAMLRGAGGSLTEQLERSLDSATREDRHR